MHVLHCVDLHSVELDLMVFLVLRIVLSCVFTLYPVVP